MGTNFSFKKGYRKLTVEQIPKVRAKICEVLGLAEVTSFYPRLNGKIEPKISEARAIEAVFAEYGITDIWGE